MAHVSLREIKHAAQTCHEENCDEPYVRSEYRTTFDSDNGDWQLGPWYMFCAANHRHEVVRFNDYDGIGANG